MSTVMFERDENNADRWTIYSNDEWVEVGTIQRDCLGFGVNQYVMEAGDAKATYVADEEDLAGNGEAALFDKMWEYVERAHDREAGSRVVRQP